jgi:O-antigen ligase
MNISKKLINLTTQDLIRWCVYAIIALVPLIYCTNFDAAFTTPKITVFRIISLLILAIWGGQVLIQKKLTLRASPLNKWLVGYGFVLGLVTLFSNYFWVSFWGDQGRFLGLATMLNLLFLTVVVLNFFTSRKHVRTYLRVSVFVAILAAVYGMLQNKGLVGAESWNLDPMLRVFGTMGHSNHFGAYLAFHFMLLIGLFLNSRNLMGKGFYLISGGIMFVTILATASRGAFFALLGAAMIFVLAFVWFERKTILAQKNKILAGLVALIVLVGVFNQPLISKVNDLSLTQRTVSTIQYMAEGNVPDRVSWWFSSLSMFKDHPVLGHGLSTFRDTYNLYRRTDYRVPFDIQDTVTPESAHMEYFNILATQGLLGFMFYMGIILCWVKWIIFILRRPELSKRKRNTALSFLAAGLVYLSQVLMSFGVIGTLVPLYILFGMSLVYYHLIADPKSQTAQFEDHSLKDGAIFSGAGLLIFLLFFGGLFTYKQASAEYHFQQADQFSSIGEVNAMIEAYDKTTQNMGDIYAYWESFGMEAFNFSTGSNDIEVVKILINKSIYAYEKAYELVQTQPYLQANLGLSYTVYAEVLEVENKPVEAAAARETGEKFYQEAIELGVNNPRYAYNYGLLLMGLGRDAEARDAFLHILTFRDPYQDVYSRLAQVEVNEGNHEQARAYAQKALEIDPADQKAKEVLERINSEV